ncbi:MAG: PSD1 and planctomycete cytochrome C domain-containing protein [Planctomycetota bacterium]|nr:PSD1 and planctomycete cytochrome C domain-containing protein [Planctomycetota bacterium]
MRIFTISLIMFLASTANAAEPISFNKQIRPILADRCFACHGPDSAQRVSDMRLDQQETIFMELPSGEFPIVRGKPSESELIHRILSEDADHKMPPTDSGKTLNAQEIELIRQWVSEGADWNQHWAYEAPQHPPLPRPVRKWQQNNPIDLFIQARLKKQRLRPENAADKETLIRRLTLDLTGLPPTLEEIDQFLTDDSPEAYEHVVDRLLKSPRYGEHLARSWLDAARYADTHGLHLDNERSMWPYRDWVIQAFNDNMPFDQFTIEQLAGDLLPTPSLNNRVATGFNRCNVTTSEGGSIDEEYYVRYAVDRVETTATVWMGLTAGCAVCHDHKFDPLSQKEFYQLFSYFFSLTERAMDGNALLPPPVVKVPSESQTANQTRITAEIKQQTELVQKILADAKYTDSFSGSEFPAFEKADRVWFDDALPPGAKPEGNDPGPWVFVEEPDHPVYSGKNSSTRTGNGLVQHFFTGATDPFVIAENDVLYAYVYLDPENPPETIQLQFNDGTWEHRAHWGADKAFGAGRNNASNKPLGPLPELGKWVRLEVPAATVGLPAGAKLNGWAFTQFGGTVHWDQAGAVGAPQLSPQQKESFAIWEHFLKTVSTAALPDPVKKLIALESDQRNEAQKKQLLSYYLENVNPVTMAQLAPPKQKQAELKKELDAIAKEIPSTLVMEDRKEPRVAHILERGEYTEKRDAVESAVPAWLGESPIDAPQNRMGLAQWLVSPTHPLTARVTVNRYWQHYFGTGLVKTSEDFGVQGERPSHPDLLDWLALSFIESGWDVKQFQKLIVMSSTYQQSSRVTPQKYALDPQNRLVSHGPRFRLDAEVIRDQVLAISGLMIPTVGGKSVKPYQPAGLWKPVGFGGSNTSVFKQDTGEKLYRRSMYTFWKRTVPPPTMTIFDAPNRETCQVRRTRTNTPLQALVLMNDVQFVEAARRFAEQVITDGGDQVEQRITYLYRSVLARNPKPNELPLVTQLYNEHLAEFQEQPEAVTSLLSAGESDRNESLDQAELAAWTMIVHLIFNLSETVTKG